MWTTSLECEKGWGAEEARLVVLLRGGVELQPPVGLLSARLKLARSTLGLFTGDRVADQDHLDADPYPD